MKTLLDYHPTFKEKALRHRRFKHKKVIELLDKAGWASQKLGVSFEGREIRKVVVGQGKKKILLWSQMHGDEATATMAIFDILNFFSSKDETWTQFRNSILSNLELHFIPMLNPDGAERFQRRTAQEIDMNRDAIALQCPESVILKTQVEELRPDFSFNLHDQAIYYAAGESDHQATMAFLATAYNKETEWNETRIRSMQVICKINELLQEVIPGRVARFTDEFEPRAFGDNIQKWGSSLILIESGGFPEDVEKQYIRSLNFYTILMALKAIAEESYNHFSRDHYEKIPINNRIFLDVKITNLQVKKDGKLYQTDLGILLNEKNLRKSTGFVYDSVIEEMGDLSVFRGIKTLDAKGGELKSVAEFPELLSKYKIKQVPKNLIIGEKATFVIDFGASQQLILNGQII